MEDIDGCIKQCFDFGAHSCVSVTESGKSPFWMYTLDECGFVHQLIKTDMTNLRRQDLPKVYILNGAVYVAEVDWLLVRKTFVSIGTVAYLMPGERSVDIDTEQDIDFIQYILKRGK